MGNFINILIAPQKTFEKLYNEFDHRLETNNNIIFILFGLVVALPISFGKVHFDNNSRLFEYYDVESNIWIIFQVLSIIFSISVSLMLGRYIFTYLILLIGKLLRGKAEAIDIRVVVAYSLIPLILASTIRVLTQVVTSNNDFPQYELLSTSIINTLALIFSGYIMIVGLKCYHHFTWWKAALNFFLFLTVNSVVFWLGLTFLRTMPV